MNKRITILGVPFDNVSQREALRLVLEHLSYSAKKSPYFIATPNPEIVLEAQKNKPFYDVLQQTDLNIPDGVAITFAARIQRSPLRERVTGTDLMEAICKNCQPGTRIFLLGAAEGVAEKTKEVLEKRYSQIKIVGAYAGSPAPDEEAALRKRIEESKADVLFVAYGAPKQELWLARNLTNLKGLKVAMGVGGAFDFIAGVRKRAPTWMRKLALEWLYRLIQEPRRIKRIFNATVKFPLVFVIKTFLKSKS